MTLLSTISNEAINENLKKRFENKEIYVSTIISARCSARWRGLKEGRARREGRDGDGDSSSVGRRTTS